MIEPTQVVKGLGRMSRPTTSCSKSLNVRTKASPRCPELPVTMTLIFDSFSLWMISRSRPQPVRLISRYNISRATCDDLTLHGFDRGRKAEDRCPDLIATPGQVVVVTDRGLPRRPDCGCGAGTVSGAADSGSSREALLPRPRPRPICFARPDRRSE